MDSIDEAKQRKKKAVDTVDHHRNGVTFSATFPHGRRWLPFPKPGLILPFLAASHPQRTYLSLSWRQPNRLSAAAAADQSLRFSPSDSELSSKSYSCGTTFPSAADMSRARKKISASFLSAESVFLGPGSTGCCPFLSPRFGPGPRKQFRR